MFLEYSDGLPCGLVVRGLAFRQPDVSYYWHWVLLGNLDGNMFSKENRQSLGEKYKVKVISKK